MYIIGIVGIIVLLFFIVTSLSPKPMARILYRLFEGGVQVTPPDYNEKYQTLIIDRDLSYRSDKPLNNFDIYRPRGEEKLAPIIWVHGGAFVAGDKEDILPYGVQLAYEGFVFINMNYDLSPSSNYPSPLIQLDQMMAELKNLDSYNLDLDRIYLAGDSAGAHIVSQYANILVNPDYRRSMGLDLGTYKISGLLLFCGVYDGSSFLDMRGILKKHVAHKIGWAYFGKRNWVDMEVFKDLSLIDRIDKNFPRTFITDGNSLTFYKQSYAMAKALDSLGVENTQVFYRKKRKPIIHEYQFNMESQEGKNTFKKVLDFLEKDLT